MDIEAISELDEDNYAEVSVNSNKDLDLIRTNTEYEDDEQAYDIYHIQIIFSRNIQFALFLMAAIGMLELSYRGYLQIDAVALPLILFEVRVIIEALVNIKREYEVIPNVWKSESFIELCEGCAFIATYISLILYLEFVFKLFLISAVPLAALSAIKFCLKIPAPNYCVSFYMLVKRAAEWAYILLMLSVGIKLDNIANYSWLLALSPLWFVLLITFTISFTSLILTLLYILSKDRSKATLCSYMWFLYTFSLGSSLILLEYFSVSQSHKLNTLLPTLYILGFIILTQLTKRSLSLWWWNFFLTDNANELPSFFKDSAPLPLPKSQQILTSFSKTLTNAIKSTPAALLRFTKPAFHSKEHKNERRKHNRTLSNSIEKIEKKSHLRSRSTAFTGFNLHKIEQNEELCRMCERETVDLVLDPCGHGAVCGKCKLILMKNNTSCLVCDGLRIQRRNSEKIEECLDKSFQLEE